MITEKLPFLLPIRQVQRKLFFYTKMHFDSNLYTRHKSEKELDYEVFATKNDLYNPNTGFPLIYQANKEFNMKLLARQFDGLLIKPQEVFSFWRAGKAADRKIAYKEGLVINRGKLTVAKGGGICQMSNMLFNVFLHSPLSIVERHSHGVKEFPTGAVGEAEGLDATIAEGWLDLKVKNETTATYQLKFAFNDHSMSVKLLTDEKPQCRYEIVSKDLRYFRQQHKVYQSLAIYRQQVDVLTLQVLEEKLLYKSLNLINYELSPSIIVENIGEE